MDDRLFGFLQRATGVKPTEVIIAPYKMLVSLARGPLCASGAFSFRTTCFVLLDNIDQLRRYSHRARDVHCD